jgi:hypothetical protein
MAYKKPVVAECTAQKLGYNHGRLPADGLMLQGKDRRCPGLFEALNLGA